MLIWSAVNLRRRSELVSVDNDSCKIQVRHVLFKKSGLVIFLNNYVTTCRIITCRGKRKNEKPIFSFPSMPNLNFAGTFSVGNERSNYFGKPSQQ